MGRFWGWKPVKPTGPVSDLTDGFLERAMGIEPIAAFSSINQIMLIRLPLLP
jgi:hypothetical protein